MLRAGDEDGEVVEEKDTLEYDIERLVEWPGFNSSLPREFRDETNKYRAAPLKRVKLLKVPTPAECSYAPRYFIVIAEKSSSMYLCKCICEMKI